VATHINIKGGTFKPTLPFRDRLGCSPNEACLALGIGRTFLYQLIAEGHIEVRKLGRRTIVCVQSLLKLLDAQATEQKSNGRGRPRKIKVAGGAS
jgi:excisionase family DNA binding protein